MWFLIFWGLQTAVSLCVHTWVMGSAYMAVRRVLPDGCLRVGLRRELLDVGRVCVDLRGALPQILVLVGESVVPVLGLYGAVCGIIARQSVVDDAVRDAREWLQRTEAEL